MALTCLEELSRGELLDEGAGNVADGDVGFLNALRIAGRHIEQQINFSGECSTGFAGESHDVGPPRTASFRPADDVCAGAAGGKRDENVLRGNERFDLPRKYLFKPVIVARGSQHRRIGCERESGEAAALSTKFDD